MKTHALDLGSVLVERDGDEVIVRSAKMHELLVRLPRRALEAWCLRKLRDEALQPSKQVGKGSA